MSAHEDLTREHSTQQSSDRVFGLTFFVFFLVIALWHFIRHGSVQPVALGISLVFLAISLLFPQLLSPLNRVWLKLGALLHSITSPIILGIMFFLVIMPIGLLMRAFGKDFLRLQFNPDVQTYWIRREPPGPDKQSLNRQF
jgi:Saxitoxin biosynthesis operon protein SxtJ